MDKQKGSVLTEVLGGLVIIAIFVLVALCTYGAAEQSHKTNLANNAEEIRKQKWFVEHKCQHTGFYGKYGQHKSFTCDDGKVYKEVELR